MKRLFRNILALSLLLIYSLNVNASTHNLVFDSVLNVKQHHDDSITYSESHKTLVSYLHSDKNFIDEIPSDFQFYFQKEDIKTSFLIFKNKEFYTLNKENQYLNKSKHIQPGLNIKTLLYPFHTFS